MLAFWMDSSTYDLYVIYHFALIESAETTSRNRQTMKTDRLLTVLERKQVKSNHNNLDRTIYRSYSQITTMSGRYCPIFIPTRLSMRTTFSTVCDGIDGEDSMWVQQTWCKTASSLDIIDSRYIVNRGPVNFSTIESLVPVPDDNDSCCLMGITASVNSGNRELVCITSNPSDSKSANLYWMMDPLIIGHTSQLNSFESLFMFPGTNHMYLTTSSGQILVMGDLTRNCK